MGLSKTTDHIQIKIKMPNPCQEPPAPNKAPNQDLKDMDVLCNFKMEIESQNLEYRWIKDQWPYPNPDQDKKPKSRTSRTNQSPKWGLKGHGCSLHLQNQDREQKSEHVCTSDQWPYPNLDQDTKPNSGTSSTKWGLKGHGWSLHLPNGERKANF